MRPNVGYGYAGPVCCCHTPAPLRKLQERALHSAIERNNELDRLRAEVDALKAECDRLVAQDVQVTDAMVAAACKVYSADETRGTIPMRQAIVAALRAATDVSEGEG